MLAYSARKILVLGCLAVLLTAGFVWANEPTAASLAVNPASIRTLATDHQLVLSWDAVPGAQSYALWINDARGIAFKRWYTAAEAACGAGSGQCTATVTATFAPGTCRWWVQTWNDSAAGKWSRGGTFDVNASATLVRDSALTFAPRANVLLVGAVSSPQTWEGTPNSSRLPPWSGETVVTTAPYRASGSMLAWSGTLTAESARLR